MLTTLLRRTRWAVAGLAAAVASSAPAQDAAFQPLGRLTGATGSRGYRSSDDGSVVVGWSNYTFNTTEAFRWTRTGGMQGLGDFAGGRVFSAAGGVSGDGTV